jgi:hypothetical protein
MPLVISGATSGSATLQSTDATTAVITLPSTTGTLATTSGVVTSAVAGNGVAVSGATGAVTFSAACPTQNTVGSYASVGVFSAAFSGSLAFGSNYAAGTGNNQLQAATSRTGDSFAFSEMTPLNEIIGSNSLSGTWKYLGSNITLGTGNGSFGYYSSGTNGLACRVS